MTAPPGDDAPTWAARAAKSFSSTREVKLSELVSVVAFLAVYGELDRLGELARIVQLTSDRARTDAHRFYERLGFVPSHTGFTYAVPRYAPSTKLDD